MFKKKIFAVSHNGGKANSTILKEAAGLLNIDFTYIEPGAKGNILEDDIVIYRGGDVSDLAKVSNAINYYDSLLGKKFHPISGVKYCADKASQAKRAQDCQIPMPKTLISSKATLIQDSQDFGFPLVTKKICSFGGKGVYKIDNIDQLATNATEFDENEPIIMQEFIRNPNKKDIRLYVLGNEVYGGIIRFPGEGDFRGNTSSGATFAKYIPSKELEELSVKIVDDFQIKTAAIDYLVVDDRYYFLEINDTYGFNKNLDLGKRYLSFVLEDQA